MFSSNKEFSLWCDFIERDFLDKEFKDLLKDGVINGATSNPAIFKQSILNSKAYENDKRRSVHLTPKRRYEVMAIEDIKKAAKILLPLHKNGNDGYVSIELDPFLANDVEASVEEGLRLFKEAGFPNVMIKIPATPSGFEVMRILNSKGIPINATLIFSPSQAQDCLDAFCQAKEIFLKDNPNGIVPDAVISVFVSRFDRKLDSLLLDKGLKTSKLGIYNATKIYNIIEDARLSNVRCLFASTGVKGSLDPEYYVKELCYKNTINTAPLDTIKASMKSNNIFIKDAISDREIDEFMLEVERNGFCMQQVYNELMTEGMEMFEKAFKDILVSL